MRIKSAKKSNGEFKVGGLTFPNSTIYRAFKKLDKQLGLLYTIHVAVGTPEGLKEIIYPSNDKPYNDYNDEDKFDCELRLDSDYSYDEDAFDDIMCLVECYVTILEVLGKDLHTLFDYKAESSFYKVFNNIQSCMIENMTRYGSEKPKEKRIIDIAKRLIKLGVHFDC